MKTICIYFSILLSVSVFAQTPIAHYPLDGNANDISGNNFNGAISGSPTSTSDRNNQNVKAMLLNGTTDYIDLPTDFDFPNRSITVWFNAAQIDAALNGNIVYSCDHAGLQYGSTAIQLKEINGSDSLILSIGSNMRYRMPVSASQWYHAAIVRTPSVAKFYINGTLVFTGNNPDNIHSSNGASNAIVGADRIYNSFFNGKIDELRIYDSALTDEQINLTYTSIKEVRELDSKLRLITKGGDVFFNLDEQLTREIKSTHIFDMSGRLVSENANITNGTKLNHHELMNGTYIVKFRINDSNKTVDRKFVIMK